MRFFGSAKDLKECKENLDKEKRSPGRMQKMAAIVALTGVITVGYGNMSHAARNRNTRFRSR